MQIKLGLISYVPRLNEDLPSLVILSKCLDSLNQLCSVLYNSEIQKRKGKESIPN